MRTAAAPASRTASPAPSARNALTSLTMSAPAAHADDGRSLACHVRGAAQSGVDFCKGAAIGKRIGRYIEYAHHQRCRQVESPLRELQELRHGVSKTKGRRNAGPHETQRVGQIGLAGLAAPAPTTPDGTPPPRVGVDGRFWLQLSGGPGSRPCMMRLICSASIVS